MKSISEKTIILSIFIFFLSVFLLIMDGGIAGDGIAYYHVAKSIVFNGSLSVDNMEGILGRDGKMYLPYGITYSLAMIPFYLLGLFVSNFLNFINQEYTAMFFVGAINSFVSALACVVIYIFARNLSFLRRTSLILVFIYAFTTMALSYAQTTFSEPLNSLFILCAIMFLYFYKLKGKAYLLVIAAAFLGLGVLTKFYDIVMLPAAVWYLWMIRKEIGGINKKESSGGLIIFLLTFAVFLFICGLINYLKFGDFLKTGYKNYSFSSFYVGLYGLLFSSGRSFFLYNPITVIGILSLRGFYKEHKPEAVLFMFITLVHIAAISLLPIWSGGMAWGPRYLFPAVPYLIFPVGILVENFRKQTVFKKHMLVSVCALGFLIQLPAVIINFARWEIIILDVLKLSDEIFLFIPNFSPVIGSWILFYSAIQRSLFGHSLVHIFNLGGLTREVNLYGYDNLNLWFFRLTAFYHSQGLLLCIYAVITIILFVIFCSFIQLYKACWK